MAVTDRQNGTRQDTFALYVLLDGNPTGIWDKKTGGEYDSDELKYYPGGMVDPVSLGGRRTPANVTLQRLYDRILDHDKMADWFAAVGRKQVEVIQQPYDIDGNPYPGKGIGRGIHWTGKLKRVQVPDVDSESTTPALLEIEVTVSSIHYS